MHLPNGEPVRAFRLGEWTVLPDEGEIRSGDVTHRLQPGVMDVLVALADQAGRVVSKQQLVDAVWDGRPVGDEVISQRMSVLRKHLGDDARHPTYIENLPRRGYRLLAPVAAIDPEPDSDPGTPVTDPAVVTSAEARPYGIGLWLLLPVVVIAIAYLALSLLPKSEAGISSIAVLAFSSAPEDAYLANGVAEELSHALAQLPGIRVAARASTNQIPGDLPIEEIARQLEVDSIIEGSILREGNRLRVIAKFVDGNSGFLLWTDAFEGTSDELFDLQKKVANGIRDTIGGTAAKVASTITEPTEPEAYDLYLQGRYQLSRRGQRPLERAIGRFRRAIELDPGYGPAYVELATAYALLPAYTGSDTEESYDAALATIEIGTARDPSMIVAAAALHGYIHNKRGQWRAADEAFRTALSAPQSSSLTHQWYSNLLASVGRLHDARAQARLARDLDPLSPVVVSRLAMTSLWVDDNAAAAEQFNLANKLGMHTQLHTDSYLLLLLRNREFDRMLELTTSAETGLPPAWLQHFLHCAGSNEDCAVAREDVAADTSLSPRVRLVVWAVLGDMDRVAETAAALTSDIDAFETELLFLSELEPFRSDPRFLPLMETTGIAQYWRDTGCEFRDLRVLCHEPASASGMP